MTPAETLAKYRAEILLAAILTLSAFLNFWNIWNQGFSNDYYAAAVKSMLENPTLLFFNSFDPAGFITVDKPPVGLWVQLASAALFGYSGWALDLPQALAGVGSVALVYLIVSRPFGKAAGLISAFVLAVTPILVAVSRNETPDGILIFVLLLAMWVALKASRERSLPYLLLSVTLIGIGFNIKMIQAFIVVPAVLAVYFLGTRELPVKKRALHIGLAIMVLVAVSLSWAVAVDLVPADQRPYIGGSGDNTVLGLIVNYNGIHRLENGGMMQGGSPGSAPPGGVMPGGQAGASLISEIPGNRTAERRADRFAAEGGTAPPGPGEMPVSGGWLSGSPPGGVPGEPGSQSPWGGMNGGPGGGMMGDTGTPGLLRLFMEGLAGQLSWLLPFAGIGILAWWRRPHTISSDGFEQAGFFSERSLTLIGMSLWLIPGLMYFSFTTGFWHPYYLATIAPPLAALVGTGAVAMFEAFVQGGTKGWLLVAAVPVTGFTQFEILSYNVEWSGPLLVLIGNGTIALTILLACLKIRKMPGTRTTHKLVAAIAIALLFIAPVVWAFTPLTYGSGGILPAAGPQLSRDGGAGFGNGNNLPGIDNSTSTLAEYLASHNTGEKWDVAVQSSRDGANLIIESGLSVMALGGFSGTDQVLSVTDLKNLVREGKVRYFMTPAREGGMGSGNSELYTWVSDHCASVPATELGGSDVSTSGTGLPGLTSNSTSFIGPGGLQGPGNTRPGSGGGGMLYDCKGYSGQSGA